MSISEKAFSQPSVMKHDFSRIPKSEIERSQFDRSHGLKTTFYGGELVPIFLDEALPGDVFNCQATLFARLSTPIVPFMDNLYCDQFWFFVPMRLVWDNWEKFCGAQDNPGDSTDFVIPTLDLTTLGGSPFQDLTIYDYFGLPTNVSITDASTTNISALPFRAYSLIWDQWFRDQNLQDSMLPPTDDGPDDTNLYYTLNRGKRHDYFTSCLPFVQKGPASVIPLGGDVNVLWTNPMSFSSTGDLVFNMSSTTSAFDVGATVGSDPTRVTAGNAGHMQYSSGMGASLLDLGDAGGYVDLSTATTVTINSLRQAFQIQRLLERDARGGTRYVEILRAHFQTVSPDFRLQRPEFLGSSSAPIRINPVAQTSSTGVGDTPQGNLAAFGTLHAQSGFSHSFVEHGYVIGLASVRADLSYQQGLNRLWSRQTRYDFYWPALAHLGEQAVLNQEIYFQGISSDIADQGVFGYQERFAEYRYKPSQICGQFRSTDPTPLDIWHLALNFSSLPALNGAFMRDNPPISRVVAVTDEPSILLDAYFKYKCARPMPTFSVPGLIDHF